MIMQVSTLAQGKEWDEKKSPAQNYVGSLIGLSSKSSRLSNNYSINDSYQSGSHNTRNYDKGYQDYSPQEMKSQTEAFFSRKQTENANRRE